MPINFLSVKHFRNLTTAELAPSPQLNIICGKNGSGKTSLLETIHYLGLGKSFRSGTATRLIQHDTSKFSIVTQLVKENDYALSAGVERDSKGTQRIRIAEKEVTSISEIAELIPLRLINSQSHALFESGPQFRRQYLDWGLFYQADSFLTCWRHFERALKQRNSLLREHKPKAEVAVWTVEMVKYGLMLNELRQRYVAELNPCIADMAKELLSVSQVELHYQPGWDETKDYATLLTEASADEYRCGYTLYGPHRADLDIMINKVSARHFLSRGQQKLLLCAMILAQGILLSQQGNKRLIYLVDDLPSELDVESKQKLITLLSKQQAQTFITTIEREAISPFIDSNVPVKVFHVEQGRVVAITD